MATRANALAMMAKAPVAGQVKTRLVPPLSMAEAAELYSRLMADLLDSLRLFEDADLFVAYTPAEADSVFADLVPGEFVCFPQQGRDLGERMQQVALALFRRGYSRVVLIGSDLPVFPREFIERAFAFLQEADLVLGPNRDGGYYLVGLRRLVPGIFEGIAWSTPQVLEQTLNKAEGVGVKPMLLPAWFDIDTPSDLAYLSRERHQLYVQLPRTVRWLVEKRLAERL